MRFPRTKFVDENTLSEQIRHIELEQREVIGELYLYPPNYENAAVELWDVIHSAETALRILNESHEVDVEAAKAVVIGKNRERGYYAEK